MPYAIDIFCGAGGCSEGLIPVSYTHLTFFSIPVGLLFGFLIAKCGFNWLVEQGNLVSTGTGSMLSLIHISFWR